MPFIPWGGGGGFARKQTGGTTNDTTKGGKPLIPESALYWTKRCWGGAAQSSHAAKHSTVPRPGSSRRPLGDGVPEGGAGAVALDVPHVRRGDAGAPQGSGDDLRLGGAVGGGQGGGAAVLGGPERGDFEGPLGGGYRDVWEALGGRLQPLAWTLKGAGKIIGSGTGQGPDTQPKLVGNPCVFIYVELII